MRELRYSDYYASYEELKHGNAFVQGNTALQLEPVRKENKKKQPKLRVVQPKKQKPRKDLYTRSQVIQNRMTLGITLAALIAVCLSCINYLDIQAQLAGKAAVISELEAEYVDLKTDNDLAEVVIDSTIDYNYILDVAINELGMVYPDKEQVVVYDSQKMEVVKQLENIPVE